MGYRHWFRKHSGGLCERGNEMWLFVKGDTFLDSHNDHGGEGEGKWWALHWVRKILNVCITITPSRSLTMTSCEMTWHHESLTYNFCVYAHKQLTISQSYSLMCKFILKTKRSLPVTWCTNSLTFNNCTLCPHCIYVFCIYLRTKSDLYHLQHKLIGFYNRYEKCLLCGTNWVFK